MSDYFHTEYEDYEEYASLKPCRIMVMGVGGAGNNAVNRMVENKINTAEFVAVNTDTQALSMSKVPVANRIVIGKNLTGGLGAGAIPEIGAKAAEESKAEIEKALEGVNLLFITAGMGGGTGTGAAPVIAKIAKEKGCLTIAVVTKPFEFEGKIRAQNAVKGIANLKKLVDTIVVIPNEKLTSALQQDVPMVEAMKFADETLRQGVCGIADLISTPATINLDFADVKTIIKDQGYAHMGVGRASGDNRVFEATKKAINSPLLETTIEGAKGVIINVTGGEDITLGQIRDVARIIKETVDDSSANIIFGANVNPAFNNELQVTVIATGFEKKEGGEIRRPQVVEQPYSAWEQPKPSTFEQTQREEVQNSQPPVENPVTPQVEEKPVEKISPEVVDSKPIIPTVGELKDFKDGVQTKIEEEKKDEKDNMPAFMRKLFGGKK